MEAVKVLIDRGADVNASESITPFHWTPLMAAADEGHANIAKLLIERGADVEDALAKLKKLKREDAYAFLEKLVKKYQPPRYRASPPMHPTALPLPTEPAAPF